MYMIEYEYQKDRTGMQLINEQLFRALMSYEGRYKISTLGVPNEGPSRPLEGKEFNKKQIQQIKDTINSNVRDSDNLNNIVNGSSKIWVWEVGQPLYPKLKGCWSC